MSNKRKRIKALTIWQPWATLIAAGAKSIETRGWPTKYRGWIAIHAAKRWQRDQQEMLRRRPYRELLDGQPLPFGRVVAVARLVDCVRVEDVRDSLDSLERDLGNFRDGRWAWQLAGVQMLAEPIPATGGQGLWWWSPPAWLATRMDKHQHFFLT